MQCIMAHLICGNGGSSDEGRDGGLCDHAVGGDAVRRGVEPEEEQREGGQEREEKEEREVKRSEWYREQRGDNTVKQCCYSRINLSNSN